VISLALTHRNPAPSFLKSALVDFRQMRLRSAQRKHLLNLDDYLLRDMGLNRFDVMRGKF
jgi:uncharacterized protein YjiS (DUF1127 family)